MITKELLGKLSLQDKHYSWSSVQVPRVEPGVYNTLGMRLFELYRKYNITPEDQRELEALQWALQSFVMTQERIKPRWRFWA